MITIVTGCQYGDEGKGRVAHYLTDGADLVIRGTGGNNAGHTVVANGKKFVMHLLPSSITKDCKSLIGPGVVIDLNVLMDEIKNMKENGIDIEDRLLISDRAHIILPTYLELDAYFEAMKENPIGTTKRGIGPAYSHKMDRVGIRICDLYLDLNTLKQKIKENMVEYNLYAEKLNEKNIITEDDVLEYLLKYKDYLANFVVASDNVISNAITYNKSIVIEGAQAYRLDIDHGDYPMVTSSNPNASGTASGCGIGPTYIDEVVGVIKAYTSRVGEGPFVTEENNEIGNKIRELGHEYGSTTGRPRRCGWLDLVMIKQAKIVNGLTSLCVNHMDTIGKFEEINVCYKYVHKETNLNVSYMPIDLENYEPVYTTVKGGWNTEGCKTFDDLPLNAKEYIELIESFTGIPVKYIGIGPKDNDTIVRKEKQFTRQKNKNF